MNTTGDTSGAGSWHRVRIHQAGRYAEDEVVRGHDRDEALAAAEREFAVPLDRLEYLGDDSALPLTVHDPARQFGTTDLADNPDASRDRWFTEMFAPLSDDGAAELHEHRARGLNRREAFAVGDDTDQARDWWGADYPTEERDDDTSDAAAVQEHVR